MTLITFYETTRERLVELLRPHIRRYRNGTITTRYSRSFYLQIWNNADREVYFQFYTVKLNLPRRRPLRWTTYYVQSDGTLKARDYRFSFSVHTEDDVEVFAQYLYEVMLKALPCGESLSKTHGFGKGKYCKTCSRELACLMGV